MSPPPLRQGGGTCSLASPLCPIARLSMLYRQLALALALALSLSFSLFALSFKRGGYQSLLSTQETLSVDDRRCEEEVLFSYAKEGAGPAKNAKCQMPNAK